MQISALMSTDLIVAREWEVLPEWVTFEPIICQNSSQIRVIMKVNTIHVPDLEKKQSTQ